MQLTDHRQASTYLLDHNFGIVVSKNGVKRLSDRTRELAAIALAGTHGKSMKPAAAILDPSYKSKSLNLRYAEACRLAAETAPLRILDGELLVGEATLLEAVLHKTPICSVQSTSHTTIDFGRVIQDGTRAIRRSIESAMAPAQGVTLLSDDVEPDLYEAMLSCIDALHLRHRRYVEELDVRTERAATPLEAEHWRAVSESLLSVPEYPAKTFRQALQSLWFTFAFERLMGNWPGIGRIDLILGPFLDRDLAAGIITLGEARELLAHFWIKGCEWIGARAHESGDAQHYQNIVLGGVDSGNNQVLNNVTWLVLDVVEELHISDFPVAVRVGKKTPKNLFRRIAEVQRLGGGIVAIYNDDVVIPALKRFGYTTEEARSYANDGCWEVLIPGKTAFSYRPFDALKILQNTIGLGPDSYTVPDLNSFERLYSHFISDLDKAVGKIQDEIDSRFTDGPPSPLLSILIDGCIDAGRSYYRRGARFSVCALHAGGLPDVANSLLAIKHYVFESRRWDMSEFVHMARNDWSPHENERLRVWNESTLYGNDDPDADAMFVRLFNDYTDIVSKHSHRCGAYRPAGISTFGREVSDFFDDRSATVFGKRREDILAPNMSPTPGSDRRGPIAAIGSYCSVDFRQLPNGTPLDLKLSPATVRGEGGVDALASLLRTFVEKGGWYLQVDVIDTDTLRDAQKNPEMYPNLTVRISGWSARFATLSPEWQELVIARTEQIL